MTNTARRACALTAVVLTAVSLSGALHPLQSEVFAAEPESEPTAPPTTAELFKQIDLNEDGAIGPEEAKIVPGVDKNFEHMDANGDDLLSKAEFAVIETEDVIVVE